MAGTESATDTALEGAETVFEVLEILIGIDLTWRLCDLYGGRTVYIPVRTRECHWLIEAIGAEPALKLCNHFRAGNSGVRLLIPKGDLHRSQTFRADIARMSDDGMSAGEIALSLNLHERTIYRARSTINQQRVNIFGKRIKRLLAEQRSTEEISSSICLPVHATRQIIELLTKSEA